MEEPVSGKPLLHVKNVYTLKRFAKTPLPLAAWRETPLIPHTLPHTHDCYEMLVIQDGTGWCTLNGQRFAMLYGDVFIMTPWDVHEFHHRNDMHYYNVMFSPELLHENEIARMGQMLTHPAKYTCAGHAAEQLLHLLDSLCQALKNPPSASRDLSAHGLFLEILALLSEGAKGPRPTDSHAGAENKLEQLRNILTCSPLQKIELKQIAQELGVCKEYAGKLVRQVTGMSLANYVRARRIEHSLHELANTTKSITEIAFSLGFYDGAFFSKQFHKIMGCSPKEYRKNAQTAPDEMR